MRALKNKLSWLKFTLPGIAIMVVAVGLFSQITQAKTFISSTPAEQAESVSYYDTLRMCVQENMYNDINTNVDTPQSVDPTKTFWFDDGNAYGYVFQGGSVVKRDCKQIIKPAIELWGWGSDYGAFLKAMGYTFESSVPRYHRTGDKADRLAGFEAAVQIKIFNTGGMNFGGWAYTKLTPVAKYEIASSLLATCGVKSLGQYPNGINSTQKSLVDKNETKDNKRYIKVTSIDPTDGKAKPYAYTYTANLGDQWFYGYSNGGSSYQAPGAGTIDCASIVQYASESASAKAYYLAQESCKTVGFSATELFTDQSLINACATGYGSNHENYTYCTTVYATKTLERKACYIGQGNEGAEACYVESINTAKTPAWNGDDVGACLQGAKNKSEDYCGTAYYSGYYGELYQDKSLEEAACKFGQTVATTSTPLVIINAPNCIIDSDAPGCGTTAGGSSCIIEGIGWIVCAPINALAGLNDVVYDWIKDILVLNPLQSVDASGEATPQYETWQRVRDISNILLVIGFLVIIFSQLTGAGVSNYGVKKLLPRVIIIAIAINLSYVVMQLSIDMANLIGTGTEEILRSTGVDATLKDLNAGNIAGSAMAGAAILIPSAGIAATIVLVGGAGTAASVALMVAPFIIVSVLSVLAAIATLFVRNALIIILVVISPLAFAAYLLPNTENLFKKWRQTFLGMLMLFPMAALLFGGARFAAYTVLASDQALSALVALFIMGAPLFALPWLAGSTSSILKGINGRLQSLAKSAKAPLQRAVKPLIDNQTASRRANERNIFGKKYSEAQLAERARKNKRNLANRYGDVVKNREANTEASNTKATEDWRERGNKAVDTAKGNSTAEKTRRVMDKNLTTAKQKEMNDTLAGKRVAQRVNTPGTVEARYNAETFDANKATKTFEGETNKRNTERVRQNVPSLTGDGGLQDLDRRLFTAQEDSKADELEVLQLNKESGVATESVQRQKTAQLGGEAVDATEGAIFDIATENDEDLKGMKTQKQMGQYLSGVAQGVGETRFEEQKATEQELIDIETGRRATEQAKRTATDAQLESYAESVSERGSATQVRAGGTVNPEEGQMRAAAFGLQATDNLEGEAVKAAQTLGGGNAEAALQAGLVMEGGQVGFRSATGFVAYDNNNPGSTESQAVLARAKQAGIVGENDTNLDNFNNAGRDALGRIQEFHHTPAGARAVATTLAAKGQLKGAGVVGLVSGIDIQERESAITEINEKAATAGLIHLSKNSVNANGDVILGGQKGGVPGVVGSILTDRGIGGYTKELLQDPDFAAEAGRQAFEMSTDPVRAAAFTEGLAGMNDTVIKLLAQTMSRAGAGDAATVEQELRARRSSMRSRGLS